MYYILRTIYIYVYIYMITMGNKMYMIIYDNNCL